MLALVLTPQEDSVPEALWIILYRWEATHPKALEMLLWP